MNELELEQVDQSALHLRLTKKVRPEVITGTR